MFSETKPQSAESALNNLFMPKRAISYIRVSTRKQAERGGGDNEGFSIPAQREANRSKAADLGAIIVKEFIDRGTSAKSADRKDLQDMLKYIEDTPLDYCIIHKVDRLIRNRWDDADISRALDKRGIKLVSTMENIDKTPAGMMMHGILATVAEFYSNNLATEVLKGMKEKAETGGTVGKAPLGYINIMRIDELGREERLVVLDEERSSLISLGFEEYATGRWECCDSLAKHLALRGLTTRATPKIPSKPVDGKTLLNIFRNPYYKGTVYFMGKYYPGKHPPLTDTETWQKVQSIITSHVNGERTRKHPHFLKGTVFCGTCGERLIVQHARSRSGVRYPYFSCAGRHSRRTDCKQKSLLIEEIERKIEDIYTQISLTTEYRKKLEDWILAEIRKTASEFETEKRNLEIEKEKIIRKKKKLLEAHYADAISLDLFKEEQQKLEKAVNETSRQIQCRNENLESAEKNLNKVLALLDNCGKLYSDAPDYVKRILNQALFEKIYVADNGEGGIDITPIFASTYALIFNGNRQSNEKSSFVNSFWAKPIQTLKDALKNKSHALSNFFGHGFNTDILVVLSDVDTNNYSYLIKRINKIKTVSDNATSDKGLSNSCASEIVRTKLVKSQKRFSDLEIARVSEEYQMGFSIYDLAAKYRCNSKTISRNLKKHGIEVSKKKIRSKEDEDEIVALYSSGLTLQEISRRSGFSSTAINNCLHRCKVDMRKRWDYRKST